MENKRYAVVSWGDKFIHSIQKNKEHAIGIKKVLEKSSFLHISIVEVYLYGE